MRSPAAALLYAGVDCAVARLRPGYVPRATPDTVRLSRKRMFFDCRRARAELGFPQSDVRVALRKAVEWFESQQSCHPEVRRGASEL